MKLFYFVEEHCDKYLNVPHYEVIKIYYSHATVVS